MHTDRFVRRLVATGALALAFLAATAMPTGAAESPAAATQPRSSAAAPMKAPRTGSAVAAPAAAGAARATGGLQYSCPTTSTICGCRGAADCKVLEGAGKCSGSLECTFSTASGQPECTCRRKAAAMR